MPAERSTNPLTTIATIAAVKARVQRTPVVLGLVLAGPVRPVPIAVGGLNNSFTTFIPSVSLSSNDTGRPLVTAWRTALLMQESPRLPHLRQLETDREPIVPIEPVDDRASR